MKTKRKVIALTFILGLLAWVGCAVGDYYFSSDEWSLGELLIFDVAPQQLCLELLAIGLLLMLGLMMYLSCTQRDRAKQEARQQTTLLQALLDNIPDPVYFKDCDHRFMSVSRIKADHWHTSPEDMIGKTDFDFFVPAAAERTHADEQQAMETGEPLVGRLERITHSDGSQHWYSVSKAPYYDADGKVAGVVGVSRDITEHKRAEEALRESHELFTSLVMSSRAGIIAYDLETNITLWNPAMESISGFPAKEVLGRTCFELFLDEVGAGDAIRQALKGKSTTLSETPFTITQTGRSGYFDSSHFPVFDAQGRIVGGMAIIHDITPRKRMEEALKETNIQLEQALTELQQTQEQIIGQERLHALGQMASGIAHDFNNALTPIVAFSETLLVRPGSLNDREKVTDHLKKIYNAGKDAAEIVKRMREFYRPRNEIDELQAVNLDEIIKECISITQPMWKEQALARGVSISVDTDLKAVPPIIASESELRQAFINLIMNAVDAMPDGGTITFRTRVHDNTVVIEAKDTGVGMTREVARRCVEPFFSTKQENGTGMGLAMVYGTIQRHHGTLDIESKPGKGTIVRIHLPVQMTQMGAGEQQVVEVTLAPLRVLLVEDRSLVCKALIQCLTHDGHSVESATNGREGLNKFRADSFDLVITDKAMPEMSGDQLALAIKETAPDMPIILLTGFNDPMTASTEKAAGVDLIVDKPVTLAVLRQAMAKVTAGKYHCRLPRAKAEAYDQVALRLSSQMEGL